MASLDFNLIISTIIIFFFFQSSVAQQPYVGVTTSDCTNDHNSSTGLGYFCNGLNTTCRTFITFRSAPPYNTIASIASLLNSDPAELSAANSADAPSTTFATNRLVIVPVACSCSGQNYQSNTSYAVKRDDNYFFIANGTFQGLSTCQAIARQSGNPPSTQLAVGQRITIPLRCACPTKSQADLGVKYLMSYLIANGDFISSVGERFGVSVDSIYQANSLSTRDNNIIGFTTLLIPLQTPPSSDQTTAPISPPPPPLPPSESLSPSSSKKKTWVYALIGAIGGVGLLLVLGTIVCCIITKAKRKKKSESTKVDPILASESFDAIEKNSGAKQKQREEEYSQDFFEAISEMAQTVKVYNFNELNKATNGFNPSCWIKGSVYRATINGDQAAIKKVDGDISREINLLQKINHSNVIRLSGVGFNEGYWYLVYEYASNGSLNDWLFNGKRNLSWVQRVQIGLDVATGLNYLHNFTNPSHVHKDVKSGNILLDDDFRAKIANFGLARSTMQGEQSGHFALTKHIVGTIGYMAPEYLEHGLVSTKLDVYAFGVLLLEILTGKEVSVLHEENKKLSDVFSGVISDGEKVKDGLIDFVDVSLGEKYPSELVGFVVRVIDNCLKKNPEARPTMDEIVQLLSITLRNSLAWELSQKF